MLTQDAIRLLLEERAARNCRPRTLSFYEHELGRLSRASAELPASPQVLRGVIASVGGGGHSRHATWRALRALYLFLVHDGLIVGNPMSGVAAPHRPKLRRRTLDLGDVVRLLAVRLSERDRAILLLILDTGMRAGEIRELRGRDLRDGWANVLGKGGDERSVPVHAETLARLRALVADPDDYVFRPRYGPGPLHRDGVYEIVSRAMVEAGLDRLGKRGPHLLRHTFGRHFCASGGGLPALQQILGHADVKTTMVYVELAGVEVASEHDRFSRLAMVSEKVVRRVG